MRSFQGAENHHKDIQNGEYGGIIKHEKES
jgi:hypothetical protein